MLNGGYLLKTAHVNLKLKKTKTQKVDEDFAVKNIGGRGWGAKMLHNFYDGMIDPWSPENKIVVAAGPLSGLPVPSSGRLSFSAISPATGLYGDSNMGGDLVVALKRAGFDSLILDDVSSSPSIVVVEDGAVRIDDGSAYWGMKSLDAEKALKKDYADSKIAVIGPAGENLVKIAAITSDFGRQAARCGIAAVMGQKKVKAIIAKGDEDIPMADSETVKRLFQETLDHMRGNKALPLWQRLGTTQTVEWCQASSCLPTRNFSAGQFESAEGIEAEAMAKRVRVGNKGCFQCELLCGQVSAVGDLKVEGPEYETLSMLGSNCGIGSVEDVVKANYICDQLGLDTISAGNVAAFAMECYEKSLIDREDTDLDLRFGNSDALNSLLEDIAHRKGLGDVLAEGVRTASQRIGQGSERFAMHVKGLEISGYDVRAAPAMALAYATCDIGAHHSRAWAITYDVQTSRTGYGRDKVERVIYLQHVRPMFDCLGVCRFPWLEMGLDLNIYAQFYTAATGIETSLEQLLKGSERVWNLTRLVNLRQGLRRSDDWLPDRVFDNPLPDGPLKGTALKREEFQKMIDEYYRLRGWDEEGVPTKGKLKELGLG